MFKTCDERAHWVSSLSPSWIEFFSPVINVVLIDFRNYRKAAIQKFRIDSVATMNMKYFAFVFWLAKKNSSISNLFYFHDKWFFKEKKNNFILLFNVYFYLVGVVFFVLKSKFKGGRINELWRGEPNQFFFRPNINTDLQFTSKPT